MRILQKRQQKVAIFDEFPDTTVMLQFRFHSFRLETTRKLKTSEEIVFASAVNEMCKVLIPTAY